MPAPILRRSVLALGAALPAALCAGSAAAGDPIDEVKKAREKLKTLVAPFTQVRHIGLLAAPIQSKGELTVVRPDKLRWELHPPDSMIYWVTKDGVWFKNSKTGKTGKADAASRDIGKLLGDLLTFVGGDLTSAKLKERYELTASSETDGSVRVIATPKTDDVKKIVKRLEMLTNPEKWGIKKIVIDEPNDDKSTIELGPNQKDAKVDADKMKPPA